MFCSQCGKKLEDGAVCTCQNQSPYGNQPQFNQPQYNSPPQYNPQPQFNQQPKKSAGNSIFKFDKLTLVKIITLGLAGVTFLSHLFFNWYRYELAGFIKYSGSFGPYSGPSFYGSTAPLGEVSGFFGFARFLLILNIFAFLGYVAWELIDFKKLVPALGNLKFDLGKLLSLVFYGLMATALFFGFVGTFFADETGVSVTITFGWIFTFLNAGAGIVNFFMPDLLKGILKQK